MVMQLADDCQQDRLQRRSFRGHQRVPLHRDPENIRNLLTRPRHVSLLRV